MNLPWISKEEVKILLEGGSTRCFEKLGAHLDYCNQVKGCQFVVFAPSCCSVSVVVSRSDLSQETEFPLEKSADGLWSAFVSEAESGDFYHFRTEVSEAGKRREILKADPFAFCSEPRPGFRSRIWDPKRYTWHDADYCGRRRNSNYRDLPVSIYEVHLGSWRHFEHADRSSERYMLCRAEAQLPPVTYTLLADTLPQYCSEMGFTHVEMMPVTEHPYDGSWGYQTTGFFSPSSRYGTPEEFQYLVDALHQAGIGIILDVVLAHFAVDPHGLSLFDGSAIFEPDDPILARHPDWGTFVFDYEKGFVRSFLLSHLFYWAENYHIDGFRLDAVASMLYLDYSRKPGEWAPNHLGGRENLAAISFIQELNKALHAEFPGLITIAEESTAWPGVTHRNGLGFDFKWNMGWMHDVLEYSHVDPLYRSRYKEKLSFGFHYAHSESFILPLSHDEVVHGKKSMVRKFPGHWWQRLANARALYGFMFAHPGKKLFFMGAELGVWDEWYYKKELAWDLLQRPLHKGLQSWIRDCNFYYSIRPALWHEASPGLGYQLGICHDADQSVVSILRYDRYGFPLLCVCNFAPVEFEDFRLGVPWGGSWKEELCSDAECYGGTNFVNHAEKEAEQIAWHNQEFSIVFRVGPMSASFFCPRFKEF